MPTSPLITPAAAATLIRSRLRLLPPETLPLSRCIGRTLREVVRAERDQPPFDRVAMDGIAVSSSATAQSIRRFALQAVQGAGDRVLTLQDPSLAIEVMTGASLPAGTDTVIPFEQIDVADGFATLHEGVKLATHGNVHPRASDAPKDTRVLEPGALLRAPEIAIAASAGMSQLVVSKQPTIAVLSTGNELVDPGGPIEDFQIRRSNAYGMRADLERRGFAQVVDDHVADTEAALLDRLSHHLAGRDVLLLSGGVSMGKFDLVPKMLVQLGVQEVFHRVAQRPGKPMWFGIGPQGQVVFGLPGNPVSTLMCLVRFVVPALSALMGTRDPYPEKIALATAFSVKVALSYFLPVSIEDDAAGRPCARPAPTKGSGDFLGLASSDGFVELPPGPAAYASGFVAPLYRW